MTMKPSEHLESQRSSLIGDFCRLMKEMKMVMERYEQSGKGEVIPFQNRLQLLHSVGTTEIQLTFLPAGYEPDPSILDYDEDDE